MRAIAMASTLGRRRALLPALFTVAAEVAAAAAASCSSQHPFTVRTELGGCRAYPKLQLLPAGPFVIEDAFPMPYIVTTPCRNVTRAQVGGNCTAYSAMDSAGAPAYAVSVKQCYALGAVVSDSNSGDADSPKISNTSGVPVLNSGRRRAEVRGRKLAP